MLQRTPLHARHVAAGARMVGFGGWEMPLQYRGIREEHLAVRERAGLFDLSHMGEVRLCGRGAERAAGRLLAGDTASLPPGGARYCVMCNPQGGIIDDVVAYRDGDSFLVVVNAACHDKDVTWVRANAGDATVEDESAGTALLAVQGPNALSIVQPLSDVDLDGLAPFTATRGGVAGVPVMISRTGYTGEDGVELYVNARDSDRLWQSLLDGGRDAGLVPAGLGARDTLRLEAGLRLYGQDMDETIDPHTCGLGWTVRRSDEDFIGAEALARIRERPLGRRFTGLTVGGRAIARHGYPVRAGGRDAGVVTSGTFSFSLGHGIATAYLAADADQGSLTVDVREAAVPVTVSPLPFYRRQRPSGAP